MKIKGFDDVFYIDEFELHKQRDGHSCCHFSAAISEDTADKYATMAGTAALVQLDDGMPVFNGIIQEISIEKTYSVTSLDVTLTSLSVLLDQDEKNRIFQDPQKKFCDLLSAQRLALSECELRLADKLKTEIYEAVAVQSQETDFAFIQRIAACCQTHLWVNDVFADKVIIAIDDVNINQRVMKIENEEIIASKYKQQCRGKKKWYSQDIKLQKYIELGRIVTLGKSSTKYVITAVTVRKVHESTEFTYEIEELKKKDIPKGADKFSLEKTIKLKARVTNVKDPEHRGRIQVEFIDDYVEDMDRTESKRAWFDYGTFYGGKRGGIVFLPDVGDVVEILFTNGTCFAYSALRQEALDEECSNVEEKYIGNNTKQRIFWKNNSLELHSFENKIYMDENKIELCVGSNQVCIDEDKILLKTAENELVLQKNGILIQADSTVDQQAKTIQIKGNSKVHMESGGSATVKSNSSLNLQGRTVHIS